MNEILGQFLLVMFVGVGVALICNALTASSIGVPSIATMLWRKLPWGRKTG
jgi:hypothetical protein